MKVLSDKDFFKAIKKESKEYSEDIAEGFPYFCLKVFWEGLSQDDIGDALSGLKTNDESVDAFFVDEENREINILQCKSCESVKNQKALKKEWLAYLNDVTGKLEDHEFIDSHRNEKIQIIAKDFLIYKKKGYVVRLHFFHMGRSAKEVLRHYDKIQYYDWDSLRDEYQEYLSKLDRTEPQFIEMQLGFENINPKISSKHQTIVSIITGDELINLREKYRYKLFDKNLRFGLGKNKINKAIIRTALDEPKNFYFYNNGITITSKGFKYKPTNNKLRVEYPQIINGAQTVNALYAAFKERENKLCRLNGKESKDEAKNEFRNIKILFRIIQDDEKDGRKTSKFEEKVIRYNNSQNAIKETDFYANYPEQIKLQELFARHGYFYEIKRGDRKYLESGKEEHNLLKKKKKDFCFWDEKLDIEKMASLWMAYSVEPTLEKVSKSNIFGYARDKYYDEIFSKDIEIVEDQVKEMILAFNLFQIISGQSEIYGKTQKKGQVVSKIAQIKPNDKGTDAAFENIKGLVQNSFFLGKMIKRDCDTKEAFFNNKENLLITIKEYQFFSIGKYLTLAIFRLIIRECGYLDSLVAYDNYKNKKFIENQLVEKWLKFILDELVKKEYNEFTSAVGSSLKSFYARASTWENIEKRFERLKYDVDKDYCDMFPIDFS